MVEDLTFKVALSNDSSEEIELTVDTFGENMRVSLHDKKQHWHGIEFTAAEWDALVQKVELARKARQMLNLPA
jgi:hypothetical protein